MARLCPSSTIATGIYSMAPTEVILVDQALEDSENNTPEYEPPGMNDFAFPADINFGSLLQLRHDLGSPSLFVQSSVLNSTISMYNHVSPTALDSVRSLYNQGISESPTLHLPTPHAPLTITSSDQSHDSYGNQTTSELFNSSHVFPHLPASSGTTGLVASGVKKAKLKGQTPMMSTKLSSLCSKAAQAGSSSNLLTLLAIHGMAGAILCVGNTFNHGLECMVHQLPYLLRLNSS